MYLQICIFLIVSIKPLIAQKLEIKSLYDDPILLIKTGHCKIQVGNIKVIHPINLTNIEITVGTINKLIDNKMYDKLELHNIVRQKIKKLHDNLRQIKPIQSTRYKRWDALGSGWKWLAGTPDAEDLRIINNTMNQLIDANNQQVHINQQIDRRIQMITATVNRAIMNSTINNKVILTEIDMLTTIVTIDTVNTILEEIQEAIVRTKVNLPSNKILTLTEIIRIKDLLVNQGIKITLPDEALQFVTPKIAINGETLLYILQVPKLEKETSSTLRIIPLVINNTVIRDHPLYLIRNNQKLYTTLDHKQFVQSHSEIQEFDDNCIKPLIMGTSSHCNVTSQMETEMQFISENKLIINNANNETLHSDCGPSDRKLTGNFLLTFWNCTITIKNRKFQSYELTSELQEIQGALYNINATRQLIKALDINTIKEENTQNRNEIKNVYLEQIKHQNWIWSLSGTVTMTSIGIIALIVYIVLRSIQPATVKISSSTPKSSEREQVNQLSYILKEATNKLKDGDALFSPPGGITFQQSA